MNPCPCGHLGSPLRACRCTPDAVARYQGRISGPLLDRIDVQVEVPAVPPEALAATPDGEASAVIAQRVVAARQRALERQGCANAALSGDALDRHCALDAAASKFLQTAAARLGWSARSFHRVLRIARSIADLGAGADIQVTHLAEAIQCRRMLATR
jgi:magnesium chelatase family protein